jgi:hypothetical protein
VRTVPAMETFLVRVWTPAGGEPAAGLRGTVRHLSTGDESSFADPEVLLAFLRDASVAAANESQSSRLSVTVEPTTE